MGKTSPPASRAATAAAAQPSDGSAAALSELRVAGHLQSQPVGAAISQQPSCACAAALTRWIRRRSRRRCGGRRVTRSQTERTGALQQLHWPTPPVARPCCAPCASWPWRVCGLRRRRPGPWGRGRRCWRRRCRSRGRNQDRRCCCCVSSCCAGVAGGWGCWRVDVGRLVGCGPLVAAATAVAAASAVWALFGL